VQLPEKLLESLEEIKGFDRQAFEQVHRSGEQVTSVRINPFKTSNMKRETSNFFHVAPFTFGERVPWSQYGYYLTQRPSFTFDPLFHAGCYYVQEASSMFLEQALKQTVDLSRDLKILDLAAAPGGKSTHVQSLISKDSLLVSNDVIRSRANILRDNLIKWGSDNVIVTNNDPRDFAKLENYFDVILIDAPCSGSGLFRRDEDAISEWSLNNVQLCARRQQRIIADVWPSLKNNGILIYSTCSYSKKEDEDILDWMRNAFPVRDLELKITGQWKIVESLGGYRFWPDKVKGEGFFIACLKKSDGGEEVKIKARNKPAMADKKEMEILEQWVAETDNTLVKIENAVYSVPQKMLNDTELLRNNLQVIYHGTMIGQLVREKLLPSHALAMSHLISHHIQKSDLSYEQAIAYLKKKELKDVSVNGGGWGLVSYKNFSLGWINVLPNRINNYYPKELRILKDI